MTDLCLRELTEILIYCGRRCLAPLNKSHKIQQNEIERIRGIVMKTSTRVISIITHVLNPLVISYKKYIYWKYFMRFISLTHVLYNIIKTSTVIFTFKEPKYVNRFLCGAYHDPKDLFPVSENGKVCRIF